MTANWTAEDTTFNREVEDEEYLDEDDYYQDDEDVWEHAPRKTIIEADADGNKYEIIQKVRTYHVTRPICAADIRAKFKPFGKAVGDQSTMVSHEPPIALEMGSVDQYERESRAEVKRLLNEVAASNVSVTDPHLAIVERDMAAKQATERQAAATEPSGAGATWGGSRGQAQNKDASRDSTDCRIRVTNVSDDVTRENLENIFTTSDCEVKNVYIGTDRVTGQCKGYAFITFADAKMATLALKKSTYRFKSVVMKVSPASEKRG